jgi:hypothetical protein
METDFKQYRKWLAIGTGVGIEIGVHDLYAGIVRVRPAGTDLLGTAVIERFAERPAGEWGSEYAEFLKLHGGGHLAATVLLPRDEVMVRQLAMPGVSDRDLPQAIGFQIDGLHPYRDEDAAFDYARLDGGANILVGITRREVVNRYAALFAEAGIRVARFTFSAAVMYGAVRLFSAPPEGFLAVERREGELETYGESPARPLFSATFEVPSEPFAERARSMALAELRLPPETETNAIHAVLPQPRSLPEGLEFPAAAMPYATALAAACPRLGVRLNLLPAASRAASSRMMYIPSIVLGALLLFGVGSLAGYSAYADRSYLNALRSEITRVEPQARKPMQMDRAIETARRRTMSLDNFRKRTRADLDALNELTRVVTAPAWASAVEINRDSVRLFGEAPQAPPLLRLIDQSPLFEGSEFTMPLAKTQGGETFGIRSRREGALP